MVADPLPQAPPQAWFGSWGSDIRLRSMAAIADGWFASAWDTTPELFADARARLDRHVTAVGRNPAMSPDGVGVLDRYVAVGAHRILL